MDWLEWTEIKQNINVLSPFPELHSTAREHTSHEQISPNYITHNAFHSGLHQCNILSIIPFFPQQYDWYDCDKHVLLTLRAAEINHTLIMMKTLTLDISNVNIEITPM